MLSFFPSALKAFSSRNACIKSQFLSLLCFSFLVGVSWGQTAISSTSPVTESFTNYSGTSTFPLNWSLVYSNTATPVYNGTAQSTGTTGGWYGNNNVSFLGSGSASNGNCTWKLVNNSGSIISGFTLSFVGRMWKSGANSPSVSVSWSISSSASFPAAGALSNNLSSLTFNDATANVASGVSLSQTVSNISIPNGQYLFIRFVHAGGSSSDNLGWDDISFTPVITPASPTITGAATATAFTTTYGTASTAQSFAVSGTSLTADLVATAQTGFEVATTQNGSYVGSVTFTQSGGSASGTVWARLKADASVTTSYNSTTAVALTSTSATTVNISTSSSGNAVSAKGLTITGLSAADKNWDGNTNATVTGTPSYAGLVNAETFSVTGSVSWAFPNSNVGNNITLTRTGSYNAPSSNYSVTQPVLSASIAAVVASAPTNLVITAGNAQLSVAFTAPTSNGGANISNYQFSLDGGSNWTTCSPSVTSSPILLTALTNGTTYDVQLRAVNSAGNGAASTTTQGTPVAPSTPTITAATTTLSSFTTIYGSPSLVQSLLVTGATLSADITATAPTGFEVSADNSTYGTTATFVQSGGSASGTLYVRLAATATVNGSYNSQNIVLTSTNATTINVATSSSGNAVSAKNLTITGLSASNKNFDGNTDVVVSGTESYSGLENAEVFSVTTTGAISWAFPNANVGTNKVLTKTHTYTAPSINYIVSQPTLTADIIAVVSTAPSISSIVSGDAQLVVAFLAPSSNGGANITNYEYSTNGGLNWVTPSPAVTSSPITLTGLTNNTTYSVQVRAVNSAGSGAASLSVQATPAASQATDYFRSKLSGNWNSASTWESSSDNSIWINATVAPTNTANAISILNGHTVTISSSVTADQLTINQGGTLVVNSSQTFTIANGTGDDVAVDGILRNSGTITPTGNLVFNSNGIYEHNFTTTPGTIPAATWNNGSTCSIIGYTTGGVAGFTPGGINQAFYNLTWNCPNQTGRSLLAVNINTQFSVSGTFNLVATNSTHVALASNSSAFNTNIANFNITGGTLFFIYGVSTNGTYRGTITTSGNYTQSGGTVYLGNGSTANRIVTTQFNLTGTNSSFTQSGGIFVMTNVPPAASAPLNVGITISGISGSFNIQNSAQFYFSGDNSISNTTNGSLPFLSISGASSAFNQTGGTIDFNPFTGTNITGSGIINLAGSFNRSGSSVMTCGGTNAPNGVINFTGLNQSLNDQAGLGDFSYIDLNILNGSTVALQNDFILTTSTTSTSSTFTVNSGGTLNCGAYIISNNSTGNAGKFVLNGTIGIGSANGISNGTSLSGNIQVTFSPNGRTYSSSANYVYYGSSSNMITGSGLPSTLSGGLTVNNSSGLLLSSNTSISNSLTLTSGILDIGANTLTISGSINATSGSIDADAGTVAFSNTSNLSLPTSIFSGNIANLSKTAGAGTLTLNDNLTLTNLNTSVSTGAVVLAANKQLTFTGALTNNGTMTIESGATFKQGTSVTGTGTYNVKQTIDNGAGSGSTLSGRFWYLGSPLACTRSSSFGTSGSLNKVWEFTNGAYANVGDATSLTPTKGYVHRRSDASQTLTFSGQNLYAQDVTLSLSNNAGTYAGWHLVSNPYTAYLDWSQIIGSNLTSNISNTYYIRSYNSNSQDVDALISYNASSGLESNTSSFSLSSSTAQYIAPLQAFWVKVPPTSTLSSTAGALRLERAFTSHQTGTLKNTGVYPVLARVNLYNGDKYDQALVYMNEFMTNASDQNDSEKMFVSGVASIYTMASGKKLVMNGLKNNKKKISVPLYLELPTSKVYQLQLSDYIMEDGLILLEDKQEGTIQDFTIHDVYSFYANSGVLSNRFVLHFYMPDAGVSAQGPSNSWVEEESAINEGGSILVSSNGRGKVTITQDIDATPTEKGSVVVRDAAGREIYNGQLTGSATNLELEAPSGIYFVSVELNGQVEVKKIFVQQ